MIILCEFVDFIKVIRIKIFALYAEVPFDRFGKALRFVGVCLGDFVVVVQCGIIALTLWFEKVLDSLEIVSRWELPHQRNKQRTLLSDHHFQVIFHPSLTPVLPNSFA